MPKHREEFLFADYAGYKMADGIANDLGVQRGKTGKPTLNQGGPNRRERIPIVERKRRHLEALAANLKDLQQRRLLWCGPGFRSERLPKFARLLATLVRLVTRLLLLAKRLVEALHLFPGKRIQP